MTPLEETTHNQRRAADPAQSAFVMANAGSGKTRVLTNRVARLLLADAPPEKILCITFTKAAAAEMAERLFSVLGEWALAEDETLLEALGELEGETKREKGPNDLAKARRLFARALETPGGLKIQTIHSFCETVLRRFPIEAGAPPGFSVLEDSQAAALKHDALDRVALDARTDANLGDAFCRLSLRRNERDLRSLLLGAPIQVFDIPAASEALARELGIDPALSDDEVKAGFLAGLSDSDLRRAHDGLAAEGKSPQNTAAILSKYLETPDADVKWDLLCQAFLVADRSKARNKIATKATDKHDPWVREFIDQQKLALLDQIGVLRALDLYKDTLAYWRLSITLASYYEEMKSARALLDFDDLIARAGGLFQQTESAWIMYKLDQGIDHILIDEAQDTSPQQWAVVENLFTDFFSGAGAREAPRSFFAVGDMKQSIYSFQGADVSLFKEKEQDLGKRLAAITTYENVPLTLSFRTTEPVLTFVDAAFDHEGAAEGLGAFPIPAHGVCREGAAGRVELWPLTPRPEKPVVNAWDAPVDAPESDHPVRVLCDRVASTVCDWLQQGERLESRGRAILPGDILILVQSRGALFRDIIQRLSAAGVPVAGPDRLKLADDPAVEDLLSYARAALSPTDDLSLAEILKSPLFGFDDDRDLFPLAHDRDAGVSLWRALQTRLSENTKWKSAAREIAIARSIARRQGPYAFFSHILEAGVPSGRRRFFARLGEASGDAIDELLRQAIDFENGNPRSLRDFVAWFEQSASDIKREMERQDNAVRVMTVHGAKGLEADIVFLLDAHREANLRNIGPVFRLSSDVEALPHAPVLSWSKDGDAPITQEARAEAARLQYEEYRRLFYVAATRARDRLYICGIAQGNNKDPNAKAVGVKSWHALATDAFERLDARVEAEAEPFWNGATGGILRLSCEQSAAVDTAERAPAVHATKAPAWLAAPAPAEAASRVLTPSKLIGEGDGEDARQAKDAAYSPAAGTDRYFRGRTLHRLLELLPEVAPGARPGAAERLLLKLAPQVEAGERERWREEVLRVLEDAAFAEVFAPGSIAETPIAGRVKAGRDETYISGLIDRLAILEGRVLVVDYKTNRPPPRRVEEADGAYIAQLAAYRALLQEIYPDREIDCALLWTYDARLMPVPAEMLDHAFARFV